MKKLDVQHFLGIYQIRMRMQEDGITNPTDAVKQFTKDFVTKLSTMPLNEEVKIEGKLFIDSKGIIIATLPFEKNE